MPSTVGVFVLEQGQGQSYSEEVTLPCRITLEVGEVFPLEYKERLSSDNLTAIVTAGVLEYVYLYKQASDLQD